MTARALEVRVRQQPSAAIIDLHGEINAFAEEALGAAYAEAERGNPEVILLNFTEVDYINSTGIALIVSLLARACAERRRRVACAEASAGNTRAIILNFGGLEYMNSSGIGLLVTLLIRVNRRKQQLLSCGLSEHYRHIFEITRLDDAIRGYGTEAEAVAAARA